MTNGAQPDVEADEAAAFGKKKKKSSRQKGEVHVPQHTCCSSLIVIHPDLQMWQVKMFSYTSRQLNAIGLQHRRVDIKCFMLHLTTLYW